ncbi:hypothetical protein DFR29_12323 [Tahibacter aquaticus]|uniref:Calcium/calmodulin-dependent protein kinase II association-domain domain-containing protein n=1 Tax=Tahibacter aquaticus TaxID=520092 RepID=A0A4R6YL62_9GAMM|nr:DUF4440 domain-containing protein [Tahibacter aquaticus]TDR37849.1 hypothetical protein DFR29_12323 [Tahibacter aquaticus]
MKTMSLVWLFFALFLAGCSTNPAHGDRSHARKETCKPTSEAEIHEEFVRWNTALRGGVAELIVAIYAPRSILLPTRTYPVRITQQEKIGYFTELMRAHPSAEIDLEFIEIGCNSAVNSGLYTFNLDGQYVKARYSFSYRWAGTQWLITSHHSSVVP